MNQKKSLLLLLALCPALAAASTAWAGLALGLLSLALVLLNFVFHRALGRLLPKKAVRELLPLLAVQTALLILAFAKDLKALHAPGLWIGYVITLFVIGAVRELLGAGSLFGCQLLGEGFAPIAAISGAPGAFLALAFAGMIVNALCLTGKEDES